MSRISSTAATTEAVDAAVAGLPEPVRQTAGALFEELERRRASDHATGQRARDAKTMAKNALVDRFIDAHRIALLARAPYTRCAFLRQKMMEAQDRGECFTIPDDRLIRRRLKIKLHPEPE